MRTIARDSVRVVGVVASSDNLVVDVHIIPTRVEAVTWNCLSPVNSLVLTQMFRYVPG